MSLPFLLLCCWVLAAQKPVRRFVLFDLGKSPHGWVEAVVRIVVVALADLAEQHVAGTGLDGKIVIQPLIDENALARGETNLRSGGNRIGPSVGIGHK